MKTTTAIASKSTAFANDCPPSVVLTLPFMPTMMSKSQLDSSLRSATETAESRLLALHRSQAALPVISRLKDTIRGLNYATHHKSLVLQVGPESAKTLYLDLPVSPSVLVDQDFHISALTAPHEGQPPFLIMLLSGKVCKMFYFNGDKLNLIKHNGFHSVYAYSHQLPERVANFGDPLTARDQLLDKFLHHMDEGLSQVLQSYPVPVFVLGVSKVVGHFNRITRNAKHVAGYIRKNCIRYKEEELLGLIQPHLENWASIRQDMALREAAEAEEAGKLVTGIEAIGKSVAQRNNRLLILENRFSETPGAIDAIIERILQSGGGVEWVSDGKLAAYDGMALIRYY